MADQIAESILFNAKSKMAFQFNRRHITDLDEIKDLIEKYNYYYVLEDAWFGGPTPRGFLNYFNKKYLGSNADVKGWYPTIDIIIDLKEYGTIIIGFSLITKKYKLVNTSLMKSPANYGEFEREVFIEIKKYINNLDINNLTLDELIDSLDLDVTNYFTWEWKRTGFKVSESIEVERSFGYHIYTDEFINTLKDICLELSDKDYDIYIHECKYYDEKLGDDFYKSIAIDIDSEIEYSVIDINIFNSVLLSIDQLCDENGFKVHVELTKENEFLNVKDFMDNYSEDDEFTQLSIIIHKI